MPKHDKGVSADERFAAIISVLSPTNPKSASDIEKQVNAKLGTRFARKTFTRDLDHLTHLGSIKGTLGHPQGYLLSSEFTHNFQLQLNELHMQILLASLSKMKSHSPKDMQALLLELENAIFKPLHKAQRQALESLRPLQIATPSISGRPRGVQNDVLLGLLKCLRTKTAFECIYKSPYKKEDSRTRKFAPLLMQFSGASIYLVVEDLQLPENPRIDRFKRLNISRIHKLKDTKEPFSIPNPDLYKEWQVDHFGWGGSADPIEKITIECGRHLGQFLLEAEIHPSQRIEELKPGHFKVEFEMPISHPIVRTFAGFAWDLHAVHPASLKTQIKDSVGESFKNLKNL